MEGGSFVKGVVLTGGQSRRMGENKALLPINGEPMISLVIKELKQLTSEVMIIANDKDTYSFLTEPIHKDIHERLGPLAGIESAMTHANTDWLIVSACDTPFISSEVYTHLLSNKDGYDVVVPVFGGRTHPLAGVYHISCLPFIQENISKKNLRMMDLLHDMNTNYIEDLEGHFAKEALSRHFLNINKPNQYESLRKRI